MRDFKDLSKEERCIEIMKYLQEEHTRNEVYDELGIPIYTLTSSYKYDDVKALKEYLEVIGAGLKQKYHLSSSMIDEYLNVKDYDYSLENVLHTLSNK